MVHKELILGISCGEHDAAVSLVLGHDILFASHSERFSRIKNDHLLCTELMSHIFREFGKPDRIVYYQTPSLVQYRKQLSGESIGENDNFNPIEHIHSFVEFEQIPITCVGHHESHAAGGYFTSPFTEATIIVVDGVGELETITIWEGKGGTIRKVFSTRYPHSIGLFYSAFTDRLGLKSNEEEFILMALAAYGLPKYVKEIERDFFKKKPPPFLELKVNVHRSVRDWGSDFLSAPDIAASVQSITEEYLLGLFGWASINMKSRNLVFSGGVALNCVFNQKLANSQLFDSIWIMPNPGDAGSSLGAILAATRKHVKWNNPFLGFNINKFLDLRNASECLERGEVIGIANGPAEFGPRALGNRSLLADPREVRMKEIVNEVKGRELFRPFAPAVLSKFASDYFELHHVDARYMQYAVKCVRPNEIPAVCHIDGTSRVEVVSEDSNTVLYDLLWSFYQKTGCPVLLNTSLNIKGEPIVNSWGDAEHFAKRTRIKVF